MNNSFKRVQGFVLLTLYLYDRISVKQNQSNETKKPQFFLNRPTILKIDKYCEFIIRQAN